MNRKFLFTIAKYSVSISIIGFLLYRATTGENSENFHKIWTQRSQWNTMMMLFSLIIALGGLSLTFVRWFFLVRALDIPFKLRDSFRLGFIGYFSNFLSLGVLGGDAIKAVFISRERPEKKPEAVSSIVLDRIMGLYALTIVCAIAAVAGTAGDSSSGSSAATAALKTIADISLVTAISAGLVAIALVLVPALTGEAMQRSISRLPVAGAILQKLLRAVNIYRGRPLMLLSLTGLTIVIHCLFAASVFAMAVGLNITHPDFVQHLVISPVSNLAGSIPLPGGMGGFEWMFEMLYVRAGIPAGYGLAIALCFRIVTILLAMIGVVYYLRSKRELENLGDS
ncbi:MAG: flippase-like domain-containing protein [Planctomycetaceae bacterium]|jgi:glycosyltransferase 2 family protein|nr:flippase-like domain-containing protein [Planctomycetaceae bacterium]MBT4723705.1 flippase-like domain-containing protein [Planctomycetaceae bacterium]MBT5123884.1 flippase-like domain-containing protein [Planctomycetaceae bacterium]MBT5885040.1 flippase-like domain-containing protein [Planctomycetaceae bacterium]MBT7254450.1 flippase-like domain-containing protein [Planctomycetaceae bacterium]